VAVGSRHREAICTFSWVLPYSFRFSFLLSAPSSSKLIFSHFPTYYLSTLPFLCLSPLSQHFIFFHASYYSLFLPAFSSHFSLIIFVLLLRYLILFSSSLLPFLPECRYLNNCVFIVWGGAKVPHCEVKLQPGTRNVLCLPCSGRSVVQVASRRLPPRLHGFDPRSSQLGGLWRTKRHWGRFPPSTSVSLAADSVHWLLHNHHWYKGSINGHSNSGLGSIPAVYINKK
jgi:hypothetical protein